MHSFIKRDGSALVIFGALTLVMTNPLILNVAGAVEDKQDALLNTWIIAWVGHTLVTEPLHLFDANIFYPYRNTLAFSETLLPQGLFALPFNLAFDNTILGYNLVLLFSFFLAAYAMYLFVFDLTRTRGAGIVAGIIFAFNPYNLSNLAQVQLLSLGWMPLAFFWLRRLLRSSTVNSQQSTVYLQLPIADFRLPFLFALCFSLQALSSFYYAFLAGFAVALYVVWFFITQYAIRNTLRVPLFTVYRSLFPRLAISAILIALFVVPFFLPYLQVQGEMGFERKVVESEPFSASLKLYTEVSPQNFLYGNLLAPRPPIIVGNYPLDNLFPGVIAFALACVGIVVAKSSEKWFYFLLLIFAFLLSLGPRLFITPSLGTDIPLPYRWLYDVFPLMRALRAPVRFDALVMLALAMLAGIGFSRITHHVSRFTHYAIRITPFLLALEYLALPAANITPVPTGDAIPQYVHWLARQPQTVVLELPMIASDPNAPLDLTTQYLSTHHWQRTPDGYSGFNPPRRGEIAYEMQSFPGERAISLLQALNVQYVIVHSTRIADWDTRRDAIARAADLQLVQQFGSDYIYSVAPSAQDATALSARVFLPNPAAPNQTYFAYIIVENRGKHPFAVKPTDALQVDWTITPSPSQGEGRGEGRTTATMPLITSSVSVMPVRLPAPPRAGMYRLDLRVSCAAIGDWGLSGDVPVQVSEPARQVVLPARVELSAQLKSSYAPGETVQVDLKWLPLNKIDAYYSASVRVVDARGNKIVAEDREPAGRTFLWAPGVAVSDAFALALPRDLASGEYSVQVLMYQAEQGVEALLLGGEFVPRETIGLGTFTAK